MKREIGVIVLAAAFMIAWIDTTMADASSSKDGPAVWLYAKGLSCPLCAHNLEAQLKRVKGVERVKIDLGSGRAGVWFSENHQPTSEQLAQAVRDSGFTFVREERP